MKRILWAGAIALMAGGQALAADLPPPPPAPRAPATYVPMAAPVYNWSGIYVGVNGGYAFGTAIGLTPTRRPFDREFQYQRLARRWHRRRQLSSFGAAPCSASRPTGTGPTSTAQPRNAACSPPGWRESGCETKMDWLSTVRGRAGWAFDRVLLYGTGGAAFAPVQSGSAAVLAAFRQRPKWAGLPAPGWNSPLRRTGPPKPNTSSPTLATRPARPACFGARHEHLGQDHREHHSRRHELQVQSVVTDRSGE